jgi:hypothetical protein
MMILVFGCKIENRLTPVLWQRASSDADPLSSSLRPKIQKEAWVSCAVIPMGTG